MRLLDLYKAIQSDQFLVEANLKKLYTKTLNETPKLSQRGDKMTGDVRYFGLSKDGTLNFKVRSQTRPGKYHYAFIECEDLLKFGDLIEQGDRFTEQDLAKLLTMNGFRVHCNDESFLYFAFQYMATQGNYEIEPETRAPKRNNTLLQGALCKHLFAVIKNIYENKTMRQQISKDIDNYLRMIVGMDYEDYQSASHARQIKQQNRAVKWKNKPSDFMNDYFARQAKNHPFLDDHDIKHSLKIEINKFIKSNPYGSVDDFLREYFQMTQTAFADDMDIPEESVEEYFDELGFSQKKGKAQLKTEQLDKATQYDEELTPEDNQDDSPIDDTLKSNILAKDSEQTSSSKVLLESTTLYRGNMSPLGQYESGSFFSASERDAENYGDTEVFELSDDAKIYENVSSLDYCDEAGLMNTKFDYVYDITKLYTLQEVLEVYTDQTPGTYVDTSPDLYYSAFQLVAKRSLSAKGYDGAHWSYEDDLTPNQYQIWNLDVIHKVTKDEVINDSEQMITKSFDDMIKGFMNEASKVEKLPDNLTYAEACDYIRDVKGSNYLKSLLDKHMGEGPIIRTAKRLNQKLVDAYDMEQAEIDSHFPDKDKIAQEQRRNDKDYKIYDESEKSNKQVLIELVNDATKDELCSIYHGLTLAGWYTEDKRRLRKFVLDVVNNNYQKDTGAYSKKQDTEIENAIFNATHKDKEEYLTEKEESKDYLTPEEAEEQYQKYLTGHIGNVQKAMDIIIKCCSDNQVIQTYSDTLQEIASEHDASKYEKEEYDPYLHHFYPTCPEDEQRMEEFELACKHHILNNKHHWDYWLDHETLELPDIPEDNIEYKLYCCERVADWLAMGCQKDNGDKTIWYEMNRDAIKMPQWAFEFIDYIYSKVPDDYYLSMPFTGTRGELDEAEEVNAIVILNNRLKQIKTFEDLQDIIEDINSSDQGLVLRMRRSKWQAYDFKDLGDGKVSYLLSDGVSTRTSLIETLSRYIEVSDTCR